MPAEPPVTATPAPSAPALPRRPRRGRRSLLPLVLLLLLVSAGAALFFYPPAWQAVLRTLLVGEAERRGLRLSIGTMEGGLLDGITLHQLSLQSQRDPAEATPTANSLRARRVELIFTPPAIPFFARPKPSWLHRLTVEGLEGGWHLERTTAPPPAASPAPPVADHGRAPTKLVEWRARGARALLARLAPASFALLNQPGDTLKLSRDPDLLLRVTGLQLTGEADAPGRFSAREVEVRAPGGLANRYAGWHGATGWRESRLTVRGVALVPGVDLAQLTVDTRFLRRSRLEGDAVLRALGGEVSGKGGIGLRPGGRLDVEIGGAFNSVAIPPLAGLLGITEPTGGILRAGQFSFRGDPEALANATGSLRAEALDFRLGRRRWQRLGVGVTILNRRITVHDLELVQSRNRLTLSGECPLPPAPGASLPPPPPGWWQDGFACQIDARLNDLRAFGQLLGPAFPELTGRMEIRGGFRSRQAGGLEGALEMTGGNLTVRRAPLGALRASVRLRNGELEVREFQATREGDTLNAKGVGRIDGPFRYVGEVKAHVKDLAPYQPAFAGEAFPTPPVGALTLDWSGDGGAESHNGAFRVRLGGFHSRSGVAALPRPVDVDAEGTYSPDSLSFRRALLKENAAPPPPAGGARGGGAAPEFQARFENGALPITQNTAALASGHFFRPEGTLTGRLELRDFALDLLPPLAPLALAPGTDGRISGWVDLGGVQREPRLNGAFQLRRARLRWEPEGRRLFPFLDVDALNADFRLDGAALLLDAAAGERPADGGAFALSGRADWTDRDAPLVLGFALNGKNVLLVDDGNARVRADLDVTLRGAASAPEIAGEVRLRDGARLWRELELSPNSSSDDAAAATPPTIVAISLADAAFDLRVPAAAPLLIETAEAGRGEILPADLRVTGSGRAPVLSGDLRLRRATLLLAGHRLAVDTGALRFAPDRPNDPSLAITAILRRKEVPASEKLRVDLFGPTSEGNAVFSSDPPRWSAEAVADFLCEDRPLAPSPGSMDWELIPPPPASIGESLIPPPTLEFGNPEPTQPAPARKLYLRLRGTGG